MAKDRLLIQPVSMDLAWNDPEENLKRMERLLRARLERSKQAPPESQIFVFPELTLTGFVTKEPVSFSLKPPSPFVERLSRLASQFKTGLVAGFPEANPADPARPYNAAALFGPDGGIAASYRKMKLFTAGSSPEASVYAPGDSIKTVDYRGWKIGFAICFDIRFPEIFVDYAKARADLVVIPACWIGGPHKSLQFRTLAVAHAVWTQAYVLAVNRSGRDPFYEYDGSEYVFSPFGESVYRGEPVPLDEKTLEECRKLAVPR